MEDVQDTISQLVEVTSELAELQDLGGRRLNDLLEKRGALIRQLLADRFDASDKRLLSIIADADRLQEKLQKRADSLRKDLSLLDTTQALIKAVGSTLPSPRTKGLDISA